LPSRDGTVAVFVTGLAALLLINLDLARAVRAR
jgi:hypothetical protein